MVYVTNYHRGELAGNSLSSTPADYPTNVHKEMLDLRTHKANLYWGDLLACATVFWILALLGSQNGHWLLLALTLGTFALYRMALFTHEICHFRRGVLPGFEWAWNALCGVPLLLPSYSSSPMPATTLRPALARKATRNTCHLPATRSCVDRFCGVRH